MSARRAEAGAARRETAALSPGRRPRCCSTIRTRSCSASGSHDPGGRTPAAADPSARRSSEFLAHLETHAACASCRQDYVETFDNRRRCNLFLTYFAHGDTRKRGMALLRFKQTYLASGFELADCRASRPPLRRARVRRHHRPAAGRAADARPPRRAGAAAALAARPGLAVGPVRRRRLRHAAAAARRRARRRTPAGRRGATRGGGRSGAVRHPAVQPERGAPTPSVSPAHADLPGSARMSEFLWVIVPLPVPDDVRGRPPVALPLRQVRLDHPLLPALREPAAAHRQPAVPLRDARRRRRPRHRPAGAAVVDGRGRDQRARLPRGGRRRSALLAG